MVAIVWYCWETMTGVYGVGSQEFSLDHLAVLLAVCVERLATVKYSGKKQTQEVIKENEKLPSEKQKMATVVQRDGAWSLSVCPVSGGGDYVESEDKLGM